MFGSDDVVDCWTKYKIAETSHDNSRLSIDTRKLRGCNIKLNKLQDEYTGLCMQLRDLTYRTVMYGIN